MFEKRRDDHGNTWVAIPREAAFALADAIGYSPITLIAMERDVFQGNSDFGTTPRINHRRGGWAITVTAEVDGSARWWFRDLTE